MGEKIRVKRTLVEMDGDEMTRIMWQMVKEKLLLPYLDMEIDYYDLGLQSRDDTDDQVTVAAARAVMKHRVGVKCATITPNAARVEEYGLKRQWSSPNGTIRGMLDGTVFRAPILVRNIRPAVTGWKRPIHIGRHAYGDVYRNEEIRITQPGTAELVFTPADGGEPARKVIHEFTGPGIIQGIHNLDSSIRSFATACFTYALDQGIDVWFGTKDTVSKTYDARFREIFEEEYEANWKGAFEEAGIEYFFTLIDDAVARIMKSEGGMLWACKNYDGDVMSDMLASAYGSLAMMTSVLVSPKGYFEYEASHGTVQKHYYKHLEGEVTSTNSTALIFAWTGGLKKRGELDGTPEVSAFAQKVEDAVIETVENGVMTGDLMRIAGSHPNNRQVTTEGFIDQIREVLEQKM